MTHSVLVAAAVLLAAPFVPGRAAAQENRAQLIDQARAEFADAEAVRLLLAALSPSLGPRDSLWAVAGYEMAAAQVRLAQDALASVWLRWVVRHAPEWPIDRTWFPPTIIDAYDEAVRAVRSDQDLDDEALLTSWSWPPRFDPEASGAIEVAGRGGTDSPTIRVVGRDDPAGRRVVLPAGTYELEVGAEGYEPRLVSREVLPGVLTSLAVELAPLLPEPSQARVAASLVRIRFRRGSEQVCANGVIASADGLVLTSRAVIPEDAAVDVLGPDGLELARDVSIAATDPARNLAVLKLAQARGEAIPNAANVTDGQYAWTVHYTDCGTVATTRTRLPAWSGLAAAAPVPLSAPLPPAAVGSALVDREGRLIGFVGTAQLVTPAALTLDVLERARRAAVVVQARPRGRFPWKWAGAGAAVAGLAVALVAGGGGGGGGGGGPPAPPPPTTGGITISFPN